LNALCERIRDLLDAGTEVSKLDAARLCEQLPQGSPADAALIADLIFNTAFALEQGGRTDAARPLYSRILADDHTPDNYRSNAALRIALDELASGQTGTALPLLRRALDPLPGPSVAAAAALHLFPLLMSIEAWSEAASVAAIARALPYREEPHMPLLWDLRALRCRAHMGEVAIDDDTCEDIRHLVEAEVVIESASAWMEAAFTLEQLGCLAHGRRLYERVIEAPRLPPGMRTNAQYRLGIVLDRMLAFDEAERHLRAAAESSDPFPAAQSEARMRIATLHFLMDDFEGALPDLIHLRSDPGASARIRAEAQLKYGTCLFRLRRASEARAELLACRDPEMGGGTESEVKADLLLAEIAEGQSDFQEASDCFNRIVLHPSAEPLTRASALTRIQQLKRMKRR
jgi:tetratricopeptide (TPR) repeat protein